jgi:predicted transcriptional regulator
MSSRTTIRLDEHLMRQLKERAKREELSLTGIFNKAIREWLRTPAKQPKRKPFVQKTYDMGKALIDITHTNALLDEWDTEEFVRKMSQGK